MNTRQRVKDYIKLWEFRCYSNGIPDEAPEEIHQMVPSYKRIAASILNNDLQLVQLGYKPKHTEWYDTLKKIELSQRGDNIQLKLF